MNSRTAIDRDSPRWNKEHVLSVPCPNGDCRVKQGIECRWITDRQFHEERIELAETYWSLNQQTQAGDSR